MAEVLAQFAEPLTTTDGSSYLAQACGAPNDHGLWEGWIEFVPINGGPPLRSSRETTQPNKGDATLNGRPGLPRCISKARWIER